MEDQDMPTVSKKESDESSVFSDDARDSTLERDDLQEVRYIFYLPLSIILDLTTLK